MVSRVGAVLISVTYIYFQLLEFGSGILSKYKSICEENTSARFIVPGDPPKLWGESRRSGTAWITQRFFYKFYNCK